MLPWLPKKFSRKTLFFSELMIVSAVIHFIVGISLFVLYRGQYESFSFEVRSKLNSKDHPVFFLPHRGLLRSRAGTSQAHGKKKSCLHAAKTKNKQCSTKLMQANSNKNGMSKNKHSTVVRPNSTKKIVQKSATMFLDKVIKQPKHSSIVSHKNQKSQKLKKAAGQHANAAIAAKEVPPVPKEVEKPVPTVQNITEHVTPAKPAALEQKSETEEVAQAETSQLSDIPESLDIAIGEAADGDNENGDLEFMGLSPEAARIYYVIQEEITTRWKPPAGLQKDLVCTIAVRLDRDGVIADVNVKKSSGVLIYDMSATDAAQEMQLPRVAWGKEFSIAFRL